MIEDKELKTKIRTISILLFPDIVHAKMLLLDFHLRRFNHGILTWVGSYIHRWNWNCVARQSFLVYCLVYPIPNLKVSMMSSLFAVIFSLSFLLFGSTMDNEGGISHAIISYEWGYKLWTSSCLIMLIGTYYLMMRHNTRAKANKAFSSDAEYL
ncbi:MAG: hypothetical protein IPI30_04465 [Saprospiraceae bacterium]|nr:hypothetical protein [Candidatus Vicinibacter affinis]